MSEIWIQILTIIVSNLIVILTFFGISISLHLGIRSELKEMASEMKDFHGRLCTLDEKSRKKKHD